MNSKRISRGTLVFSGILVVLVLCIAIVLGISSTSTRIDISSISSVEFENYVISENDSSELIRLLNSYTKTTYAQGFVQPDDDILDTWIQINCNDGGYYLLHYWYVSAISLNPFHFGEDDYWSLLTYFDSTGAAGTTWKLEYDFDRAFIDWQREIVH